MQEEIEICRACCQAHEKEVFMSNQASASRRWWILAAGVAAMLFAGILYAWSILKVPFAEELGYGSSALALNFTLTMSFFCLGGLFSSALVKRLGVRATVILSGILAGAGFALSSLLQSGGGWLLYVTYALMAGLGIGIAYIVLIATVNAWFPDKRGTSSGALMMGFGASSLLLGNLADRLFASPLGWRGTYPLIGVAIAVVLILASLVIKRPDPSVILPAPRKKAHAPGETFEVKEYTPLEMIRRFSFWRGFVAFTCITAVGSSVISFARELALSVGAGAALATTLVGVLAVCNGLGRIITGAVFDALGRRFTMIAANILAIVAAAITLVAVSQHSLPLCIVGLCLTGMSYGTVPTNTSAFASAFYGTEHFGTNLSVLNFNLMLASFMATACSAIRTATGGYVVPFAILLGMASLALALNISVKKP